MIFLLKRSFAKPARQRAGGKKGWKRLGSRELLPFFALLRTRECCVANTADLLDEMHCCGARIATEKLGHDSRLVKSTLASRARHGGPKAPSRRSEWHVAQDLLHLWANS